MTTDDRLSRLAPHQQEFHRVLVDDFEQLSVKYRNAVITDLDHRDRARYEQLDEIRRQTDARHDALIRELDTLVSAVREVADTLGKFDRRLGAVERGYQESKADRAELRKLVDQHSTEIQRLADRVLEFDLPADERQKVNATLFEMLQAWPDIQATLTQIREKLEANDATG